MHLRESELTIVSHIQRHRTVVIVSGQVLLANLPIGIGS